MIWAGDGLSGQCSAEKDVRVLVGNKLNKTLGRNIVEKKGKLTLSCFGGLSLSINRG